MNKEFLKAQGTRILSELNDFKRTAASAAAELNWDSDEVKRVLAGDTTPDRMLALIEDISAQYPIDKSDLMLTQDDCIHGVRVMPKSESVKSARVFERRNRHGELTPYYEYRDTAMSRHAAFRPEWISQIRIVEDNDADNPDAIYNNGHFMHQVTYFVGPVNFYYRLNGKNHCAVMNTGDSNYITPYIPHSFTSREPDKEAYIVAVTFGGEVKRALDELYRIGKNRSKKFLLASRDTKKGPQDLLDFHLQNELLTRELFQKQLDAQNIKINVIDRNREFKIVELEQLADVLNIEVTDLLLPAFRREEEVVVTHQSKTQAYEYQSSYRIYPGARCHRMPLVKCFNIVPLKSSGAEPLQNALHTYLYNYTQTTARLGWEYNGERHEADLNPGDSAYLQPYIPYTLTTTGNEPAGVFAVGIPGSVNLSTQRELSAFADFDRVIAEDRCWFTP